MSGFKPWVAKGPSAGLVQQHFVKQRLAQLDRMGPGVMGAARDYIEQAVFNGQKARKGEDDRWMAVFDKINKSLQDADLTINFNAASWFSSENTYETYAQAYQRSGELDDRAFLKSDSLNPADVRARVDDRVTVPADWAKAQAPTHRGLRPGATQSTQAIKNRIEFGAFDKAYKVDQPDKVGGVISKNARFNAKAKQVFAALNYGRRPNGSSVDYGYSYLVLSERYKLNSIYFGNDTFYTEAHADMMKLPPASQQAPYAHLASVLGMPTVTPTMKAAIIDSCYRGRRLGNTNSPIDLFEAHVFQEVAFKNNLKEVVVSVEEGGGRDLEILKNARKFAAKHGAKFVMVGHTKLP